uniref:Uncharacterized protein n=1 Tax=Babesia bovis TaxID=5865 RepID=S6BP82_BABBO|nr:hypothetical protein [Babesia bovis]
MPTGVWNPGLPFITDKRHCGLHMLLVFLSLIVWSVMCHWNNFIVIHKLISASHRIVRFLFVHVFTCP